MCFVSAWAIGLLIAAQGQRQANHRLLESSFSATTDVFGMQATLTR
jgi:hypothetical protein